jgi:deoxyribodipyrimidine photo-lyase
MASAGSGARRAVVWFRNDLRLRDNAAVAEAAAKVKGGEVDSVVPLYVFDPRSFKASPWGNVKTGPYRCGGGLLWE